MNILDRLRQGVTTGSAEETRALAAELAAALPADVTLALHGDLGVGKTTFVQGLARGFGITSPVTCRASVKYTTASTMSSISTTNRIGDRFLRDSCESCWCIGVFTTPGATALKRIPSLAYSIARLSVIASKPPFVTIGKDAFTPAIGW